METQIKSWILNYVHWMKAHEKLLIVMLAAFVLYRGGQGIENIIRNHDAAVSNQAHIVVATDEAMNKQLQDQLTQLKIDSAKQAATLDNQIFTLVTALNKQKQIDAQSSPDQIAERWQALLSLKPGTVTSGPQTTSVINEDANQTVQALEEIPVLKSEITALTTELGNDQKVIIQQDNVIAGLNKQIVDEKASHVADVNLEKAKARHSFWKGFKIGFVVGAVGTEIVRVWAGHP